MVSKPPTPKKSRLKKFLLPAAAIAIFLSGENHQDSSADIGQLSKFSKYDHTFHEDVPPVFEDLTFKQHVGSMVLHEWDNESEDDEDENISFLYSSVSAGLESSFLSVQRINDCTGGVYLLPGGGVFKPMEEEVLAPKEGNKMLQVGYDHPQRAGFKIGEGALREVAAYLIDKANGSFSGVPTTCLVSIDRNLIHSSESGQMVGSLQELVTYESSSEDLGGSNFQTKDVHRIALLDLRLFNTDRHGGNLLVTTEKNLIPIDHGLCLPDVRELGEAWFEWLQWEQCKHALSKEEIDWVNDIDIGRDANILNKLHVRPEAIMTLYVTTHFLKLAVRSGWTLFDIGSYMQRPNLDPQSRSGLELLIKKALSSSKELETAFYENPMSVSQEFIESFVAEVKKEMATSGKTKIPNDDMFMQDVSIEEI